MQELLKEKTTLKIYRKSPSTAYKHKDLIATYMRFCEQGMISGRPHAASTMKNNRYFLKKFLSKYEFASYESVRAELLEIPVDMFAKREKTWVVVLGFCKWLAEEGYGDPETVQKMMKLKPRRHKPAKQLALSEEEIDLMEKACKNAFERAIVMLLSQTGARSSEFCSWTMQNVNLETREVKFRGKGNKDRWVGLTDKAYEALKNYLELNPPINDTEAIFRGKDGKQLKPDGLGYRVRDIASRVNIHAHPHAMRRSFVTINVTKGRNLIDIQLACGHSDLKVTRGYIRIEQQETVNRMKNW